MKISEYLNGHKELTFNQIIDLVIYTFRLDTSEKGIEIRKNLVKSEISHSEYSENYEQLDFTFYYYSKLVNSRTIESFIEGTLSKKFWETHTLQQIINQHLERTKRLADKEVRYRIKWGYCN